MQQLLTFLRFGSVGDRNVTVFLRANTEDSKAFPALSPGPEFDLFPEHQQTSTKSAYVGFLTRSPVYHEQQQPMWYTRLQNLGNQLLLSIQHHTTFTLIHLLYKVQLRVPLPFASLFYQYSVGSRCISKERSKMTSEALKHWRWLWNVSQGEKKKLSVVRQSLLKCLSFRGILCICLASQHQTEH